MKLHIRNLIMYIVCTMFIIVFQSEGAAAAKNVKPKEAVPFMKATENEKKVYLTFDDGPSINTINILDILDQFQVKATFFVMANEEPYASKGYREIIKRGHAIALHSYSHDYKFIYRSKNDFFTDLKRLELLLEQEYGVKTHFIRLPGGSGNKLFYQASTKPIIQDILRELKKSGYVYVDWNVDSKDGDSPFTSAQEITRNVLSTSKEHKQAIILLHDINSMKNTVKALPTIIEALKKDGFTFDIIDENTPIVQFH
jgi:peptidoglycan-N-acetylglucosamine deacetylase